MFLRKKGQETGGNAAVLVTIIALLIILYILFIPPETRNELLGAENKTSSTEESKVSTGENITFIEEYPGKIDYTALSQVEHDLPSVTLFSVREGSILKEKSSIYITKSLFSENPQGLGFKIEDTKTVDNVLLSFTANKKVGRLVIKLNNEEVFSKKIDSLNVEPVKLKKDLLKNENILRFEASSPGILFWRTNEYELGDVKITADITDNSKLDATLKFIVDDIEKSYAKKGTLKFSVECEKEKGKLSVSLNGNNLYSAVPECQDYVKLEFMPYALAEGDNRLEFSAASGAYLIDQILLKTELKSAREFIYDFKLNSTVYKDIKDGKYNLYLTMAFADEEDKEADLLINGQLTHLSTDKLEFKKDLKSFIKEGMNTVKVIPKASMYVQELKVQALKK